jgi:hypothetical protein
VLYVRAEEPAEVAGLDYAGSALCLYRLTVVQAEDRGSVLLGVLPDDTAYATLEGLGAR